MRRVRRVTLFLGFLALAFFGGCTVAEQSMDGVGTQFQDGLQGRGAIVPNNPTTDSFGSDYR